MRKPLVCALALLAVAVGVAALGRRLVDAPWQASSTPQLGPPGADVIAAADGRDALGAALSRLGWDDVAATVAGTSARAGLRREVLEATNGETRPEVLYLRGLLLLAESRPEESLAAFAAIPTDRIPPAHLYAPYRLHESLRPGQPNPYRAPLVAARRSGTLPPLIAARVAAVEGDLRAALQGYVASDPAQWAQHDVVVFRALRLHAGLSPDAGALLAAALRAGRVPERLRPDLGRLLAPGGGQSLPELRAGLKKLLEESPGARQLAVAAVAAQLRARQLFLSRQYETLVREHRASEPTSLPDGTLVLLVLSANQVGDATLTQLWSQELRRRHPEPEVAAWLGGLRAARS